MKLNKLFLIGAVALGVGLTACNNDTPEVNSEEGTTYAGLSITVGAPSGTRATRAADANATAAETVVTTAILYGEEGDGQSKVITPFRETALDNDPSTMAYNSDPWKTTAGTRNLALVLNAKNEAPFNGFDQGTLDKAGTAVVSNITKLVNVGTVGDVFSTQSIVMSAKENTRMGLNIADNVTYEQAKASTADGTNNRFDFSVVRTVAKAIVANEDNIIEATNKTEKIADISNLSFAVVNGRTSTYVTPRETPASPATTGVESDDYVRLGTIDGGGANTLQGSGTSLYRPISVGTDNTAANVAKNQGIYFMENVVSTSAADFKWKNTAYAKVYATYKPVKVLKLNGDDIVEDTDYAAGDDFYKGETTGRFYSSKEAALKENQKYYTYTNGKCMYRVFLNNAPGTDVLHNTERNHIYYLKIASIEGLGANYDVVDPDDPNLPKPDDPNEGPGEDPDTPVNETKTYMRVVAKIVPWTLVDREVNLK